MNSKMKPLAQAVQFNTEPTKVKLDRPFWIAILKSSIIEAQRERIQIACENLSALGPINPSDLADCLSVAVVREDHRSVRDLLAIGADPASPCSTDFKNWFLTMLSVQPRNLVMSYWLGEKAFGDHQMHAPSVMLMLRVDEITPYCLSIAQWNVGLIKQFHLANFSPDHALQLIDEGRSSDRVLDDMLSRVEKREGANLQTLCANIHQQILMAELKSVKQQVLTASVLAL